MHLNSGFQTIKNLAQAVGGVPLDGVSVYGLHGQRDVGGDGVRQSQVEHQVVNIGPAPHFLAGKKYVSAFGQVLCWLVRQ